MQENLKEQAVKSKLVDSGRCETCQYWVDLAMLGGGGSRYCRNPRLQSVSSACDFNLPTNDSAALVSDDIGFLQTGPDFGCNQWQEKVDVFEETMPSGTNVVKMTAINHDAL